MSYFFEIKKTVDVYKQIKGLSREANKGILKK